MTRTTFKLMLSSLFCVSLAACAAPVTEDGTTREKEGTQEVGDRTPEEGLANAVTESGDDSVDYAARSGCCVLCKNRDAYHWTETWNGPTSCNYSAIDYCSVGDRGSLRGWQYGSCMYP